MQKRRRLSHVAGSYHSDHCLQDLSLCTYRVRIMKNCPLEFAISFRTLRAAAGVALKVRSTMLRFNNAGGGVAVLAAALPAPGDGVGVGEAACSSDKGAR